MKSETLLDNDYIPSDSWVPVFMDIIKDGKALKIRPHGYSMYPFLASDRDEVLLKSINQKLKRGDVVLYRRDNGLHVLHRIHHVSLEGYYLIGDNQSTVEGPLRRDQILAIAVSFIRKGKEFSCQRNVAYVCMSRVWLMIIPVRSVILKLWRRIQLKRKKP